MWQKAGASQITGVDISEEQIKVAKSLHKDPQTSFLVGDCANYRHESKVDVVTFIFVLNHAASVQ